MIINTKNILSIHANLSNGNEVIVSFHDGKPLAFHYENFKVGHLDVRSVVKICDLTILNGAVVERLDVEMKEKLIDAHRAQGKRMVAFVSIEDGKEISVDEYVRGFLEIKVVKNQISLKLVRENG